ncbi:MAG: hypothetical protein ACI4XR_04120 [Bacilli bacterium]
MMKKINKKHISVVGGVFIFLIILFFIYFLGFHNSLDINGNEVTMLYDLIEHDINYCDGLVFYQDNEVSIDSLSYDQKMCLAYQKSDDYEEDYLNTNKNKENCSINKKELFLKEENEDLCKITKVKTDILNKNYDKIFNDSITNYDDFRLNGENTCYFNNDDNIYYCGSSIERKVEVGWSPTTYRFIQKAVKKGNNIIIYDYLLLINNNICYEDINKTVNSKCTDILNNNPDKTINIKFVKKYGSLYKHIFTKNEEGNYYWKSTAKVS